MVTIFNVPTLVGANGPFVILDLVGDPEIRVSKSTGKPYVTTSKISIASTFSLEEAERLIGKELPGKINRMSIDPYTWINKQTGEERLITHRSVFVPEDQLVQTVLQD